MSKKRMFRVSGVVTISIYTDVEAAGEHEAAELAAERSLPTLCHQCAHGNSDDEWSLSGELDGEPDIHDAEPLEKSPVKRSTAR